MIRRGDRVAAFGGGEWERTGSRRVDGVDPLSTVAAVTLSGAGTP